MGIKILLLIVSGPSEENSLYRETWDRVRNSHSSIQSYWLGISLTGNPSALVYEDPKTQTLSWESPTSSLEQVLYCFRREGKKYDYVVRIASSSLLSLDRLYEYLCFEVPRTLYYAGEKEIYEGIPYCTKFCYILSSDLVRELAQTETWPSELSEEVAIGQKISASWGDLCKPIPSRLGGDTEILLNDLISDPYQHQYYMQKLYPFFERGEKREEAKELLDFKYLEACTKRGDLNEHVPTFRDYARQGTSVVECVRQVEHSVWGFLKGLVESGKSSGYLKESIGIPEGTSSGYLKESIGIPEGKSSGYLKESIGIPEGISKEIPIHLTCCAMEPSSTVDSVRAVSTAWGVEFSYVEGNDTEVDLPEADLYFIDSWHVYAHMKAELERFSSLARKYLLMHDTVVDALQGESVRLHWNTTEQARKYGYREDEIRKGIQPAIEEFLQTHRAWRLHKFFPNNHGLTVLEKIDLEKEIREKNPFPKVLMLIISSSGEAYDLYRSTWFQYMTAHPFIDAYFVEFREDAKEDWVLLEETRTLTLKGKESILPGILDKTLRAFRVFETKPYDYFVRTNLSTLVHLDRFYSFLQTHAFPTGYYAGKCPEKEEHFQDKVPYCPGDFFILSPDLVRKVTSKIDAYFMARCPWDDVAIGQCLVESEGFIRNPIARQSLENRDFLDVSDPSCFRYRCRTHHRSRVLDAQEHRYYAQQIYPDRFDSTRPLIPHILVLIIASYGFPFDFYREAWAQYMDAHPSIDVYFMDLVEDQKEEVVVSEDTHTITVRGKESCQPGILNKTVRCFQFFDRKEEKKYDYIVRTNLSTLIHLDRMYEYFQKVAFPKRYYAGTLQCHGGWIPYCAGDWFALSPDLLHHVATHMHEVDTRRIPWDDVAIGKCLFDTFGDLRTPVPRQMIRKEKIDVSDPSCFRYRIKTTDRISERAYDVEQYMHYASQIYPERFSSRRSSSESIQTQAEALLTQRYLQACTTPSDLNEHVATLMKYAKRGTSVVELGMRGGVSSWGFLMGLVESKQEGPKTLRSVDVEEAPHVENLRWIAQKCGVDFSFQKGEDTKLELPEADLYFIDTWHVYAHMKVELDMFHEKVRKYFLLHDTEVDGIRGESLRIGWNTAEQARLWGYREEDIRKGIQPAIEEFLSLHTEWRVKRVFTHNHGLTILERGPSKFSVFIVPESNEKVFFELGRNDLLGIESKRSFRESTSNA